MSCAVFPALNGCGNCAIRICVNEFPPFRDAEKMFAVQRLPVGV